MKMHHRFFLFIFLIISRASSFNHPEIQWKTVATQYFTINYYDKTEPAVFATWKIAEEVFEKLAPLYEYKPVQKMTISLAEYDDMSNGFAEWTSGSILIWMPDARFDLRSNTTWLRNVITHEMAHVMSLEQKRSLQLIDINVNAAISTPNESYSVSSPVLWIPDYPTWLVEGIAQLETERHGNDAFDSRREMILRSAVLSNSMLSLDEMGNFNHDRIGNEMVYNQGFSFTRYIAGKIGIDNLRTLFKTGTVRRFRFNDEFRRATGLTLERVHADWKDSLRVAYVRRFGSIEETFATVVNEGTLNRLPKYSPDGTMIAWLGSGPDDFGRTDLCIATADPFRKIRKISYAHTSFCFSSSSDAVYYIKSRTPDRNGSYLNDIFVCNLKTGQEKRITQAGRVYDLCAIPGSHDLLCVAYTSSGYGLYRCTPETGTLTEIIPARPGDPVMHVTVNPADPADAVVARLTNGQSRLYRCSLAHPGALTPVTRGNAQEESPFWAKDGRIYFSADYDGVFNIYSIAPDGTGLLRHSRTKGGNFSPCAGPEGTLLATHYHSRAFSIVKIPLQSLGYDTSTFLPRPSFKPLPVAGGPVSIKSEPYDDSWRRSVWEAVLGIQVQTDNLFLSPTLDSDNPETVVRIGVQRYKSDALHKKEQILGLSLLSPISTDNNISPPGQTASTSCNSLFFIGNNADIFTAEPRLHHAKASLRPIISPAAATRYDNRIRTTRTVAAASRQQTSPLLIYAQPGISYQNSTLPATLGYRIHGLFLNGVRLLQFNLQPYFSHQIARDWTWGGMYDLNWSPTMNVSATYIPLYLHWSHTGYLNEDFSYNTAGRSEMELSAGYLAVPGFTGTSDFDTTDLHNEGIAAQFYLSHTFPLSEFHSLEISTFNNARFFNRSMLDSVIFNDGNTPEGILDDESDIYLLSHSSATFNFPVRRVINRGSRYHFDALYGFISYSFSGYANHTFLKSSENFTKEALTDPDFMPESFYIDHRLTFGIHLGMYKSYLFFNPTTFAVSFSLVRQATGITLNLGL